MLITFTVPTGTRMRAGRNDSGAPSPTLTLSGPATITVGTPASFQVVAANLSSDVPTLAAVPQSTLAASFDPSSVNPALGELTKLFAMTATAAGTHQVKAVAAGGIESNVLSVVASQTSTPPPPPPPPSPGSTVANLRLVNNGGAATAQPYSATLLPRQGQVPAGSTVLSTADSTLRGGVIATHGDGSAAVIIVAGQLTAAAGSTTNISVQLASSSSGANLGTAAISAAVTSVSVAFGGSYGTVTITDFSAPERIWWATPTVICARYRVSPPTPGATALQAVIDIHAYAGARAQVEVVVENSLMLTTAASPTAPADATYTGATVTINGSVVATVSSSGSPEGTVHRPFRAWYASGWVGGDPGIRATQLVSELQQHPLLFACDQAGAADLSVYASDAYTPWSTGRQRASGMGAGGDHDSIGPLPKWEARFLQTGDARAARAVEASALAVLTYGNNYRDSGTGLVPTLGDLAGKSMQAGFPNLGWDGNATWEAAHHPAAGLMAFVCRPSPVFIEIAQKIAAWNGVWSTYQGNGVTGVFGGAYQVRGRGWCMRSLAHAVFLTPDALPFKAAGKASLAANVAWADAWRTDSKQRLGVMWENTTTSLFDHADNVDGFQFALWFHFYWAVEMGKIASARLLSGTDQTALETLADWGLALGPRWVNEQPNGGWRYPSYKTTIGTSATAINTAGDGINTWADIGAWNRTGSPSGVSGPWMSYGNNTDRDYSLFVQDTTAGAYYPSYLWSALVAAVERGVSGAAQAWATVLANITTLATWRAGFGADPRWGSTPRVSTGWGSGTDVGTISGGVWTPGRDAAGVINAASVATLTANRWYEVEGSRLDALQAEIEEAYPGYLDPGNDRWAGVTNAWVGMAYDTRAGHERGLIGPGGGHAASANNGLYSIAITTMRYAVEILPTPSSVMSPYYIGSTAWPLKYRAVVSGISAWSDREAFIAAGINPDSPASISALGAGVQVTLSDGASWSAARVWDANNQQWRAHASVTPFATVAALPADWDYDEVWDPVYPADPIRSSRKPTPRHTYHSLAYSPERNEVYMGCRRMWIGKLDTAQWQAPLPSGGNPAWHPGENNIGWWDEVRGIYCVLGNNLSISSADRSFAYNPTTGAFSGVPFAPVSSAAISEVAFEKLGRTACVLLYELLTKPKTLREVNLDTGAATDHAITLGASFAGKTFPASADAANYWDMQGMCYVAPLGRWLCNVRTLQDGYIWAWIDASTYVCEVAAIPGAPAKAAVNDDLYSLEGKLKYFPSLGVVVWFRPANANVCVMRVSA